jgi:hypothetical protein
LSEGIQSDLGNQFIHDISLMNLLSYLCRIDTIWGTPVEISNPMGGRPYKAAWVKTDIVVAAIARWFTTTNKSVIINKCQPLGVKVF